MEGVGAFWGYGIELSGRGIHEERERLMSSVIDVFLQSLKGGCKAHLWAVAR